MELEFLTVNLWGLPWPVARQRRLRKRRFAEHLAARAYDVVGIQELWWPWRRALALRSLALPESPRDSGLALAGRLPARELRVEPFEDGAGPDRLKRKGCLRARVQSPCGTPLAIGVLHLQAGRRHGGIRRRQVAQLLDALAGERLPAVLLGDFNFYEGSEDDARSAAALAAAGFRDAALQLGRTELTYHAASNPYLRGTRKAQRFDRVYLRDGREAQLEAREVEVLALRSDPVSDHHPLRVRLRVAAGAERKAAG